MWNLPGPARWLRSVTEDCASGQCGIVLCPAPSLPADVALELHDALRRDAHAADADEIGDGSPTRLVQGLRAWLGLDDGSAASVEDFARDPALGSQTLIVDCRAATVEQQGHWLALAAQFAASCKEMPRSTRPRFWVFGSPCDGSLPITPRSDVTLRVRWWWGVMGGMDALTAAVDLGIQSELAETVAEVVRWDLDLLEMLRDWDGAPASLESLVGEPRESIVNTRGGNLMPTSQPPVDLIGDWGAGLVESWNGELALHIAVEMHQRADALASRVWLAQVARLTPLIEMERWRLASLLDEELRRLPRQAAWKDEDITILEIGPLFKCYRDHLHEAIPPTRRKLLRLLTDTRNDLAHRRALPHSTVASLRQLVREDR